MADSNCEVLLNLHNTGIHAMKSYYANLYKSSPYEHNPREATPRTFKPPYDGIFANAFNGHQPPSTIEKYTNGNPYNHPNTRQRMCFTSGVSSSEKLSSPPSIPNKLSNECTVGSRPHANCGEQCRSSLPRDVYNTSPYARNTPPYYNKTPSIHNNTPYCKQYESIPPHNGKHYESIPAHGGKHYEVIPTHSGKQYGSIPSHGGKQYESIAACNGLRGSNDADMKLRHNAKARLKYTPLRSDMTLQEYSAHPNGFYTQKSEMDKRNGNDNHKHYEKNYPSYPTNCRLPCCSSLCCEGKNGYNGSYYGCRDTSPTENNIQGNIPGNIPGSNIPGNFQKMDYNMQSLSNREPGENSAFSPIRPSHVRRVHSTESGYSSEHSNGICNTMNGHKETEPCNRPNCCSKHYHNSPIVDNMFSREVGTRINGNENREHITNIADTPHLLYENSNREHNFKIQRATNIDENRRRIDFENHRQTMNVNDDPRERQILENNYRDIEHRERRIIEDSYRENIENDKRREYEHINMEKHRQYITNGYHQHVKPEIEEIKHKNNENVYWKMRNELNKYRDHQKMPVADNRLDVSDEASKAAMKAFDAHIRKMMSTSGDRYPIHHSSELQSTTFQSKGFNYSVSLHNERNHSVNRSYENNDSRCQANGDKHPFVKTEEDVQLISNSTDKQLFSQSHEDKQSFSQSKDCKQSPDQSKDGNASPRSNEEEHSSNQLSDNKNFSEPSFIVKIPSPQSSDHNQSIIHPNTITAITDNTKHTARENNERDIIEEETKEKLDAITRDELPSPELDLQCPAVDSTQIDEITTSDTTVHDVGGLLDLTRVANEHLGQALAKEKKRSKNNNCLHLWQFLRRMLDQEHDKVGRCIEWTNRESGEFRLIKTAVIADLWGQSKNRTCMTYEKMARAMRYYYKMNILEKVPHKRLHFRFGERILSKVLHTNNSKHLMDKTNVYQDMAGCYNLPRRDINASYNTAVNQTNKLAVNDVIDFPNGNNINTYLSMHNIREGNTITYLPTNIPPQGINVPQYFNEHTNNILHHTLPHNISARMNDAGPPPQRELASPPSTKSEEFLNKSFNNSPRKLSRNSVTPPEQNSSLSPYSGEETPESWSDSDGELVVDTDSE